jgi:hypothetical protein
MISLSARRLHVRGHCKKGPAPPPSPPFVGGGAVPKRFPQIDIIVGESTTPSPRCRDDDGGEKNEARHRSRKDTTNAPKRDDTCALTSHARTSHRPPPPSPPPPSDPPPPPDNNDGIAYATTHDPSAMAYETQPAYLRTSDANILLPRSMFLARFI